MLTKFLTENHLTSFRSGIIAEHFTEMIPSVTYEGDNSVLLQQTAKFILMKESMQQELPSNKPSGIMDPNDFKGCLAVLEYVTLLEAQRIQGNFQKENQNNAPFNTFWNEKYQRQLIDLSKLWGVKSLFKSMIITLEGIKENHNLFVKICRVFASVLLEKDTPALFHYGFTVKKSNAWELFTAEEFNAMIKVNFLLNVDEDFMDKYQKHSLPERKVDWMRPRL